MKYVKDLFKIIVFVAIMYLPLSWISFQGSLATIDKINQEETAAKMKSVENTAQRLLKENKIQEACQRLDAEVLAKNIATYTIVSLDSSCYKPEGMSVLPPIKENDKAVSFTVKGIPLTFIKFQTNQFHWAISTLTPQKINIYERLRTNQPLREALLKDFLLVIYTVFAFILCAVLIFAESIQNRYKKQGQDPVWLKLLSKIFGFLQLNDLKIIKSATSALVKQNEDLSKDIDLLQTSLEYSVLNEIKKNNLQIPYSIFGTVSKVDINGFSKVVAAGQAAVTEQMTTSLENFGCELLQRYDGLFEKTIGDEIVVVFKGDDSKLRATAFSRDLMFEFSQVKFSIQNEKRQFTLKSAISSSEITFSKRASGYGFLGDALTFTTRLMDAVKIKDKNILSVISAHAHEIAPLVYIPEQAENFEFKNMPNQLGYQIERFKDVRELESEPHLLRYFRADDHILYLLNLILLRPPNIDTILDALLKINVRQCGPALSVTWIKTLEQSYRVEVSMTTPSQMAKIIMLGKNLIPKIQWNQSISQSLIAIPRNIEGRINASVIDVLMEKDINAFANENPNSFLIPNDASGRTQANILVFQAISKIENRIFIELNNMLKSSQSHISKSGMYAACQIIEYYRIKNPAALETFESYKKTADLLQYIKNSKKIRLSQRLQDRLQNL